jgi:hypothetical protein
MRRIDRRSAPWLSHHLNGSLLYHKRCVAFSPNDAHDAECTVVRIVANAMRYPADVARRRFRSALAFSRAGRTRPATRRERRTAYLRTAIETRDRLSSRYG